jgi:hypothetical protein
MLEAKPDAATPWIFLRADYLTAVRLNQDLLYLAGLPGFFSLRVTTALLLKPENFRMLLQGTVSSTVDVLGLPL